MATKKAAKHDARALANRRLSPIEGIGYTILIYVVGFIAAQLLVGVIIAVYATAQHQTEEDILRLFNESVVLQFVHGGLFYGLVALLTITVLGLRKVGLGFIGWVKPRFGRDIGYAALGLGAYFLITIALSHIVQTVAPSVDFEQKQQLGFNTDVSGYALLMVFVSLVILPPLVEELITRGFLFSGLRSKLPFVGAAIITSIIFALAHLQPGSNAPLLWAAAVDTFALSLVLCYLREKTGSLWPCIALHAFKNGIAFLALFIFKIA